MLSRWFSLFMAIQSGRQVTPAELAERTERSVRTIYRDLKGMQDAGLPIFFDADQQSYRLTDNFQMKPPQLTSAELVTLMGALDFMRRTGPTGARRSAEKLMDKLLAGLPRGQREEADELGRRVIIDPLNARGFEDEGVVGTLEQALSVTRKVRMTYAAFIHGGKEEERVVRPLGLVYRGTSRYLVAYCELRSDIRTFRVGRIRAINLLAETFAAPPDFDLDGFLTGLWGITEGPETEVRLHFGPKVAQLAQETRWHPSQTNEAQPDGSIIVTMTMRGPAELSRWIAGYGGHVGVLAPESLRQAVLALARGTLAAYE